MEIYPSKEHRATSVRELLWVTVGYVVLAAILTYPVVLYPSSLIAGDLGDELLGLYMCRQWMHSLAEGHLPVFCADIGRPYGYPFGFTSLHQYQAAIYMLLHPFCSDTLIHNSIFFSSFILAGLGAYLLARELFGDRKAAFLAGVIYSFGAPHAMHAWGHTPTMTLQWIPFFLLFWIRLVRGPSVARLLLSVLFFVMAACSELYQGVFCAVLGGLYLFWYWWPRRSTGSFPYRRMGLWLGAFCLLVLILFIPLFWPLIWMEIQGYELTWPAHVFLRHSVPLIAWLVPSTVHLLGRVFTVDYLPEGMPLVEICSYYGVLTLLLLLLVLLLRVRFPERAYLVSALAACMFLAWASLIPLRGGSLYQYIPVLARMRSPNRFNIPGGLMLAMIAAVGYIVVDRFGKRFLEKRGGVPSVLRLWEWGWFLFAVAFLSVDLCIAPYSVSRVPDLPSFFMTYPPPAGDECFLELPVFRPGSTGQGALTTYWQSYHRWPTTGGYMAYGYMHLDSIWHNSPFGVKRFLEAESGPMQKDIVGWDCRSFLDAYNVRYVVLHTLQPLRIPSKAHGRLSHQLRAWMEAPPIYRDAAITVYDPRLIKPVQDLAFVLKDGFYRVEDYGGGPFRWSGDRSRVALVVSRLSRGSISFQASAFHRPRKLRAMVDGREVGQWIVPTGSERFHTEPFDLERGRHELLFLADGSDRPVDYGYNKDTRALSIRYYEISWSPLNEGGV